MWKYNYNNELYHFNPNHDQLGRFSKGNTIGGYISESISNSTILKYRPQAKQLSHVRINKNTTGKVFTKNKKLVAMVNVEKKDDGHVWVQGIEIFGNNKGKGLSYPLLDYAVKNLGASRLSVNKNNKIAKHVYDKYGFKTYSEDSNMYYMEIKRRN